MDSFVYSLNVFPHFQIPLKRVLKNFLVFALKERLPVSFTEELLYSMRRQLFIFIALSDSQVFGLLKLPSRVKIQQ